jgi:hypothetical protein
MANAWVGGVCLAIGLGLGALALVPSARAFDPWDRCNYAKTEQQRVICADRGLHARQRDLDRLFVAARSSPRARMESDFYESPFGRRSGFPPSTRTIAHDMEDDFYAALPRCGLNKACIRDRQDRMIRKVTYRFSLF